jgi:hypothetical protein
MTSTTHERPAVDNRAPADAITEMVERVLALARTLPAWNGRPCVGDDRIYTPHKAIRRVSDHMIDHLAQFEAHIAGSQPVPDTWYGSYITTEADLAPFYEQDVNEARNRLLRLADVWKLRLATLSESELDRAEGDAYTPREMAFCVAASAFYAEAVGRWPRDGTRGPTRHEVDSPA